jgi:hypothetical protein
MAASNREKPIRGYVAKEFNELRSDLLRYARTFFPDKIQDFSESSVGGLMLDLAAAVGDTSTFYLDHQFRELSWSDAVEIENIERLITNNGVKIIGATPSNVDVTIFIEVPAVDSAGVKTPDTSTLPVVRAGSLFEASNTVPFTTIQDLDFSETDQFGNLVAKIIVSETDDTGVPLTFILSREVKAVSGKIYTESFSINSSYVPFRTINLSNSNVSEILSVIDSDGNNYYEVESLTQDTVFIGTRNYSRDSEDVEQVLELIPAPRRFVHRVSLQTRGSALQFGGGDIGTTEDDIFPDPSKLSLPTFGRGTIPRFTLDPNSLLRTNTLGVSPSNTTLIVVYRAGGGIDHNVNAGSIRTIRELNIEFKNGPSQSLASSVRSTVDIRNSIGAVGGARAPSIDELRAAVPAARNSQGRIVTKSDLIARVYSLPSKFGRVFRASARSNPNNPLSTQLAVLSQDSSGRLIQAPDTLKKNIQRYVNEFRLISDAIDVVDARVINYGLVIGVIPNPDTNPLEVIKTVLSRIKTLLNIRNFQIDQAIQTAEIINSVITTPGVLSLTKLEFQSLRGLIDSRQYADTYYDFEDNNQRGLIVAPPGSIFELRYPDFDIVVTTG